jgi:hypothetical protein
MADVTTLFGTVGALSVATERTTESVKGFPLISEYIAVENKDLQREEPRKMGIHVIAIVIGFKLAYAVGKDLAATIGASDIALGLEPGVRRNGERRLRALEQPLRHHAGSEQAEAAGDEEGKDRRASETLSAI